MSARPAGVSPAEEPRPRPVPTTLPSRPAAAAVSVASNSLLIVLKAVAGILTGSIAILTDAIQSSIDLIASIVAYVSLRKADEPADDSHRYGHEKMENLAAALEGQLILVGAVIIVFAAVRRLVTGGGVDLVGVGIAVAAVSTVVNLVVSSHLARVARATESMALAGDATHLRTDALTSFAVLLALALVRITGADWIDPVMALLVAGASVVAGLRIVTRSGRVLADETLPPEELAAIHAALARFSGRGVVAYHKLRTRRAGALRYVDLHVQFRAGTTLEQAHATAHALQDEIARSLPAVDVLIHLEPADKVLPGTELVPPSGAPGEPSPGSAPRTAATGG